ncbi:hypothetical protein [Bacillus altitudinis]|uniref:hypothetical protein n=1 Tax=Bacillus altitudinis TaxID=293387 RepID=UPI0012F032AE|nr:hypothetical protein [Bacillus altitudinis]VXA96155.1 conserved hypothetical protein [Bacillus altitudinis]
MIYQVRISSETARLLEELKLIYEQKMEVVVTKGNVLMHAFYDSEWVDNDMWKIINEQKIHLKNDIEIKPSALRPKLQISNEVETGIKELKNDLPKLLGVRSVTIGVCIRLILKAAYIKNDRSILIENVEEKNNFKNKNVQIDVNFIKSIIEKHKEKINLNYDGDIKSIILDVLKDIENEITK